MAQAGVLPKTHGQNHPPGPRGHPLLGVAREFQRDPLQFCLDVTREYGGIARYRFGPWYGYIVSHPDYVRHILQDNHRNYRKGLISDWYLKPLIGNGLVTSEGSFWLHQRRLAQPAFHRQRLASFATAMTDSASAMLDDWARRQTAGAPFDVAEEMMRLTLTIVGKTLFSSELAQTAQSVGPAMAVAQAWVNFRSTSLFSLPEKYPTPRNRAFIRARAALDQIVYDLIAERRREGGDRGDLLSMLLNARDEDSGEGMTDAQLRDEVLTLMLAGHETTSNALTWTWYLLSRAPDVARRLRRELDDVLAGRTPTVSDLPNLKYIAMVVDEAMRLYPPAWALSRGAIHADEIGGYTIPKDALLTLSPYVTHRLPEFWPNPEGFDPERFAEPAAAARPRYAYFPFGGGPRQCIGNNFATMEAILVLSTVAQRYRLDLVPGHPVELQPYVTLRPRHGLLMTLHPV